MENKEQKIHLRIHGKVQISAWELSGLPNANGKSQRFSYAISHIAPLPPVVALNRNSMGERQSIAQKGVRAIDARKSQLENGSNAAKTSVRAPGLSADEREHPFV